MRFPCTVTNLLAAMLSAFLTSSAAASDYIPAFEKLADWQWGDEAPDMILPAMTGKVLPGHKDDTGFAASANGGWIDDGLVFFAEITDSYINNPNSDTELWKGDACEFFIVAPGSEPFEAGSRVQVVVAAPDENGNCRIAYYTDNNELTAKHFKAIAKRTGNGYKVTAFFPWEALGANAGELIRKDGFRFNMFFDNFEGGIYTLSSKPDTMNDTKANPLFMLAETVSEDGMYDIRMRVQTSQYGVIAEKGEDIEYDAGYPCTALLKDAEGNILAEGTFPDGTISLKNPDIETTFLEIVRQKGETKLFTSRQQITTVDMDILAEKLRDPETPAERIAALGVINALECIKSTFTTDNNDEELFWRMKALRGEDISGAPGILRYLALAGDPAGLVQIGIARGNSYKNQATMTVHWGGIPVAYAEIKLHESEQAAEEAVKNTALMRHMIPVDLPEADSVYAGRGLALEDGIPTDADPEHLVSVIDPSFPSHIVRGMPLDALEYASPKAFTIRGGASEEHIALFRSSGLPEISLEEAGDFDGAVIHIGSEGLDQNISGVKYSNIGYGIANDMITARKGNLTVSTSYGIPAMAKEIILAVFECEPVSAEKADAWRQMRLASLGGDLPELREKSRLVRTGEVHCHTFYSDGSSTPGTLLAEAIAGGFDFIIITDHDTVTGAEKMSKVLQDSSCDFPFFTGIELTLNSAYHINVFPLKKQIFKDKKPFSELIAEARAQGAVVMLNHPMTYGVNLKDYWYNSLAGSGIDAVERNMSQREIWRKNGYEAAFLGSTDTHSGIFGHMERSVFMMDSVTGDGIVQKVIDKCCGMIVPDLPGLVYGDRDICMAVRAALGDPERPALLKSRQDEIFADFDIRTYLQHRVDGHDKDHAWGWMGDPDEVIKPIPERE